MPLNSMTALSRLQRLWLCEAIRLREDYAGPLEDDEANRQARATGGDLARRIETRALFLARRDGQWQALLHWLQGARLAAAILILLALLSGIGLALAALGNGQQPVNAFWALGSLLGLNLLLLLGWLLVLPLSHDNAGTLGRLWLWLSEKLARDAQSAQLVPALILLLQRQHLQRWALGTLVHGWWTLVSLGALGTLLILLATRRYEFLWETTILGSDAFIALTHSLGLIPAWLGFAIPDAELIQASGNHTLSTEAARQSWASWLVGVTTVYALLPRLLLSTFCFCRWRLSRRTLRLDLDLPGHGLLRTRLLPASERIGICDTAPDRLHTIDRPQAAAASQGALLVAVELDTQRNWPPALPQTIGNAGIIDSREQRQALLEQLTRQPPARLLIACDPHRSPDRGTLALLAELARCAGQTRIWLLSPAAGETPDAERLAVWHERLDELRLEYGDEHLLNWLDSSLTEPSERERTHE